MNVVTLHRRQAENCVEGKVTPGDLCISKLFCLVTVRVELVDALHNSPPSGFFFSLTLAWARGNNSLLRWLLIALYGGSWLLGGRFRLRSLCWLLLLLCRSRLFSFCFFGWGLLSRSSLILGFFGRCSLSGRGVVSSGSFVSLGLLGRGSFGRGSFSSGSFLGLFSRGCLLLFVLILLTHFVQVTNLLKFKLI